MNNKDIQQSNSTQQAATSQTRKRSVTYPRYSLQQAEKLAMAAFDIGPRNCDQDKVAQAVGYKNAQNGAFVALRATTNQFGLISYGSGYLSVSEPWIEIFNSEDAERLRQARLDAMYQPDLYKQLLEDYANRQLPSLEKFTRDLYLNKKYGILKDAASIAAQVFIESARYAGLLDSKDYLQLNGESDQLSEKLTDETQKNTGRELNIQQPPVKPSSHNVGSSQQTTVFIPEGLDRIEVQLLNGKKAYLFVPVPLPFREKERLKKYIDLILEETELNPEQQPIDIRMNDAVEEDPLHLDK